MQGKVSSILQSKFKINNVKIERAHIIPRRKRSHNKNKPRTIVFKLHSFEDKESIIRNVYQLKDTGYYISEDFSKAIFTALKNILIRSYSSLHFPAFELNTERYLIGEKKAGEKSLNFVLGGQILTGLKF